MEDRVRKIYDRISKRYHEKLDYSFYNDYLEKPSMLSLLKDVKNKKILDIGCGFGRYAKILRNRGAKVWGIDISPKMIEIAKSEVKNVDFKVGSVYNLPYDSEFFDIVLSSLVIEHFKNLNKAFKEIRRVLEKNGVFVFSICNPFRESMRRIKGKPYNHFILKNYFKEGKRYHHWPTFKTNMLYFHRTLQTLIQTMLKNGFILEDYSDVKPNARGKRIDFKSYKLTSIFPYFSIFKLRKS